jgi:hypothetical protein
VRTLMCRYSTISEMQGWKETLIRAALAVAVLARTSILICDGATTLSVYGDEGELRLFAVSARSFALCSARCRT